MQREPIAAARTEHFVRPDIHASMDACSNEHLFVRELTHRINNELMSTISFVSLAEARSDSHETKRALASVREHVYDLATIYRCLQAPPSDHAVDLSNSLRELCRAISRAKLKQRNIELVFIETELSLKASRCWLVGMVVSELITNAIKHAFAQPAGQIRVELQVRGALAYCIVADNGSAPNGFRAGSGTRIVRSLANELHGTVHQSSGESGTTVVLAFPMRETERNEINRVEPAKADLDLRSASFDPRKRASALRTNGS